MRGKINNIKKIMRRISTIFIALFFVFSFICGNMANAADATPLPTIISGMTSVQDRSTLKTTYGGFTGNEAVLNLPGSFEEGEGQTILGGDGTFSPMSQYNAGSGPLTVTTGYFDNDNYIDLVVSNNTSNTVSFLHGNGDGTFTKGSSFGTGIGPYMIATGDFNGDGKADIAVANSNSNTVSVLIGNRDGTFNPKVDYPVGNSPFTIVVNDFNRDGKIDLAVADMGSGSISVLMGKVDGTFNGSVEYPVVVGSRSVVSGDFNNDGNIDLVSSNTSIDIYGVPRPGLSTISILIGRGDGTFEACRNYSTGDNPYFITKGDFDGNGNLDIAIANGTINSTVNTVSILMGDGAGGFTRHPDIPTGGKFAISIISGDFNTDGKTDLVVTNVSSGNVTVMLGNGDGTFSKNTFSSGVSTHSLTSGDFNRDGKIDLVIANYGTGKITVLLGKGVPPGTTGTGYDLFGFLKGNLDDCLGGIILTKNSSNCFVSNTYSNNMRVMTSRTYIEGKDDPLFETAALVQKNAALVVGDVSGVNLDDFAYWGRNLAQGTGTSTDTFWGLSNYTSAQSFSTAQFKQYAAKITELQGEAALLANGSLIGTINLQSDSIGTAPASGILDRYPNGKVWHYDRDLVISSTIQFKGKGTIIVNGNLTINPDQSIKPDPLDTTATLGIIVLGNVIFKGNNTVNAAIFAAGSTLTGGVGGNMSFTGDNVNLIGSFVAAGFPGIPGRSNISLYYNKNLGSNWPPGFGSLNMPHPTEN